MLCDADGFGASSLGRSSLIRNHAVARQCAFKLSEPDEVFMTPFYMHLRGTTYFHYLREAHEILNQFISIGQEFERSREPAHFSVPKSGLVVSTLP